MTTLAGGRKATNLILLLAASAALFATLGIVEALAHSFRKERLQWTHGVFSGIRCPLRLGGGFAN